MLKKIAFIAAATAVSTAALAGPQCPAYPDNERIPQDKFQQQLKDQGYSIQKFKVTSGNCYEIYGRDKQGQKVEIYFDAKTGQPVKTKTEK